MKVWGIRLFFIIASAASCYIVYRDPITTIVGFVVALLLVGAEICLRTPAVRSIIAESDGARCRSVSFSHPTVPAFAT